MAHRPRVDRSNIRHFLRQFARDQLFYLLQSGQLDGVTPGGVLVLAPSWSAAAVLTLTVDVDLVNF